MVGLVVVTRTALLIARRAATWTIEEQLAGRLRVAAPDAPNQRYGEGAHRLHHHQPDVVRP